MDRLVACSARISVETHRQTDRQTVTHAAHARRWLMTEVQTLDVSGIANVGLGWAIGVYPRRI